MFSIQKPTDAQLKRFLREQRQEAFTYSEVGETLQGTPQGYSSGRRRVRLGQGHDTYARAIDALRRWQMFPKQFVDLIWPTELVVGNVVATLFHAPGFWTVNPCRIVYTVDQVTRRDGRRYQVFGFAYGTVGSHLAAGEERFTVELDFEDETVWYEVFCFSRASHWLAKAAYPYFRLQQHRFRHLSGETMQVCLAE